MKMKVEPNTSKKFLLYVTSYMETKGKRNHPACLSVLPNMLLCAGEHVKYRRFVCNELHLIPQAGWPFCCISWRVYGLCHSSPTVGHKCPYQSVWECLNLTAYLSLRLEYFFYWPLESWLTYWLISYSKASLKDRYFRESALISK